jgi:hypothetical protein
LELAALNVKPVPNRKPWDHGWMSTDYRRSDHAAITTADGPVTIVGEGLEAWEEAATRLLKEARITARWEPEEFWGVLAGMVAAAASAENPGEFIEDSLSKLRNARSSLTVILLANTTWDGPPTVLGDLVVGNADEEFLALVNRTAAGRPHPNGEEASEWLSSQVDPRHAQPPGPLPVAMASWSPGQGQLGFADAERKLRALTDLTLLLEKDLEAHQVYRRGGTNRPGVRGLTLDRGSLDRALAGPSRLELTSEPMFISGTFGSRRNVRWYGSEPFPLGRLLAPQGLRDAVVSCLHGDPISNRIRVAARWFAEAHYAEAADDAALALGVAMDALLTGKRALPGSAMADRYALLSREPNDRLGRVSDYLSFYEVRSSVAHGGTSSKVSSEDFLARYISAVQWAAWRYMDLRESFAPSSDREVDLAFDGLRLGVHAWPPESP